MLKVDTILAVFRYLIKMLESTQERQMDLAGSYAASIATLEVARQEAIKEADRATKTRAKLKEFLD